MIPVGTPIVSEGTRRLCLRAGLVGAMAFLYGLVLGDSIRAWQSLLVNFLFFGGLAQAGVVISAIMQVTSSRWGRALKRTSEATSAFLPISFILLLVLL
ncbi:MAG: molybdopterin oxidoreductase, partial [bacterium]